MGELEEIQLREVTQKLKSTKLYFYVAAALAIIFLGLVFYVKKDATGQAKEFVAKQQTDLAYQKKQIKEIIENNNVLWDLVVKIEESDKTLKTITLFAKEARLPGRQGEKAFLSVSATSKDGMKGRVIGWEKYSVTAWFDSKDMLTKLDVSDLLGKSSDAVDTASGEAAE